MIKGIILYINKMGERRLIMKLYPLHLYYYHLHNQFYNLKYTLLQSRFTVRGNVFEKIEGG